MRPRPRTLRPALRHLVGAVVAVGWLLGAVACCHTAHAEAPPAAPVSEIGAAPHTSAHLAVAVAGSATPTHLCAHKCADIGMPALQACQMAGVVALLVAAAMAAILAPFAGPVFAGTRDPPLLGRPFNQYLSRNILVRICICRC